MNKFSKKLLKYRAIFFVLVFLFFVNVHSASAATRTWTGTTSGAWSVASNWGGTAPVAGDDLVFPNGASNLSNTNDLTENIIINSITFTGSGYTLSGSPIILGPGLAGITDSVASGGNTIALDIRLDATRDIIVTNTAESLTISGRIAGAGGINKEGTGTLILTGANTYGGTTKINVGVINARHSTALGTIAAGTEVVGNAVLELQGNINISYEALALRGYGVSSGGALRNISGDNTYAGLITLSSAGGTEIASDAGTLTLNGGVTGAFGLYIDGSGNVTFSKTPIATGAGAVTKTGSGTLTYNFPNTYTGQTTINTGTLLYGVDNAILSGAVVVTGGTLDIATYSDMVGTVTLGTLDLASGTITGSTGMLSSATWTVYNGTISAIIAGDAGALTKSTSGTVVLTRPNQYTGATTISLGILEIQDSLSLGTIDGITTVTAGATLQINGTGLSIPEYITFSGTGHLYTGAIRNTTGDNALTGLLTMGAAAMIKTDTTTTLSVTSKGLSATTLGLTIGGDGNTTFSAPIYGTTAALTKQGAGTLTLEAFNNFTGATNINYGEVVLSGSGAMPLSTTMTISSGGTLTLDNTSSSTVVDRIADSLALTMNGGNFKFIGSSSINTDETAGVLTAGIATQSGNNTVTVVPGSGGSTTMQFASLTRTAGASILFRGTSFGSDPALNVSTLLFKTAPTLTGSSGAANSTTISIIAGAFGDDSVSGTGTDMVTYGVGNSNGLRLLNGAGFSGEYASSLTSNANVKLTSSTTAATSSINSLILSSSASIANAGTSQTITLASGNIINLVSSNTIAGSNTTIAGGSVEINILNPVNLDISSLITTTGGLTKSGAGTLTFSSSAKTYTGLTSVNGGTLLYALNNAISSGNITVNNGTLDIATYTDTVGAVILQTGTITGSSGVLTGTSYSLREGTVSAIIAGSTVVVTRVATNTAPDSVVLLTRENTYTGATTITSGILKIGTAGNGTNTPLGTTGGGTTIANIAALDLNGYTLSTTEAITSLNGLGYGPGSTVANGNSNMGAIMNSSGTPVSYSGAITLGAASRINADYGAMTISSNISGAFAFTSGGFSNMTYSGVISTVSSITKDGIGTLTLSGSNSMAGAISVNVGTVKLGATGGATNTPLGTVAGTTTVALGARLDLNGFSLGTAEPIALNSSGYGLGDFASGGIMNSSASAVTFSGSIANSAGVIIKADFGDINLTAASTITNAANSIVFGGTGNGTVAGTTNITSGTVQKIGTGTWTLSGASTYTGITHVYHGTLKLGGAGSGLNSPLGVIAGGTTVYSGAVLDLNGYTLATAEPLTANGRGISDGGAVVNNSGSSTGYSGAIVQATDSRITNTGAGLLTLTGGVTGAFALYVGGAGNITFSTGVLGMAAGTLTKQGAGTVTATGTHTYTGATRIDAGNFVYGNGTTVLAGTNLTVAGGTFNMGGSTDSIGSVTLVNGTISNGTLTGTAYTAESGTISAALAGGIAFIKNTNNTVTLTGANTISSTTTINAGNLVLSGSGSAVSSTFTINLGGTLTLDNSTTAVASRLGDALALTMNGGNFNFIGNSAGTASETTGALTPATGHNTVTVTPGAGGSTVMTFASLSRTAGSTVLFRGTSLGTASAANISTLVFTATPTLTGGGGASGSTTVSVIKGAFGDTSLSGTGSDMVTYQGGTGLRLLNGAGFSGEYSATLTTNTNVKLTADVAASTVSINSLILNGYGITNASATITMAAAALSGNILMNSATNIAGANTTLGITTYELDILATANATMSAVIGTATSGFVAFSGSSNVTFSAANLYTGTTFINGATFFAGASNVLSSGGVTIVGGTYNLNGNSDTIGALSINAGTVTTGAGVLTLGGTVTTIANNNVASVISGYLGLGANRDFNVGNGDMDNDLIVSAVISGAFTLTKLTGTGLFMLSGNNTYTGLTTVSAGTLRLGGAGGATNTPLGTTAGSTTVTGASSALDLNGYTLGTAEALTLSGASANGALQNTSSTGVSYSGLITLGAASTIISNYGDINITNTGNITGTGFLLTVGGAGNGSLASNLNTSTSGALTKNGFGVWTVSGTSTFTGATTVNVGTLKLGAAGNGTNTPLGTSAGGVSVTSGAIFDLNGFTLGTAETATISGTGIASIGAFINSSNNTISYSGAITLGAASRVVNYGSGVLTLTGAISGNFALTVVTVGDVVFSTASTWTGSGTLVKQGSGTLTLAGQYAMNGNMTVSTGVLKLGADGGATNTPLGVAASTIETVAAGAVLDLSTYSFNGASTYERLNLSGTGIKNGGALISSAAGNNTFGAMTVTTGARVINSGSGTVIFAGTITAANGVNFGIGGSGPVTISGVYGATATTATLTKRDSGILTISAASITTGLVRVNGGNLNYGVLNALATPALTVAGGTVDLKGFNETNIGQLTLIDGSIVNTGGAASLVSTATYIVENGTISAVLGGPAIAFTKNTGGTVTLSAANTFAGTTTINAGIISWGINDALSSGALTITGGFADLTTRTDTVGAVTLTSGGILSSTGVLTGTSYPFASGTVSAILGGAVAVAKTTVGTVSLTGVNTYSGTTTITAGVLRANSTSALGDGSGTNTLIFNGGTLQAGGTISSPSGRAVTLTSSGLIDTNNNTIIIAGTVGSASGFTKQGIGTLSTTGAVTLGAALTVSQGTFDQASSLNMTAGTTTVLSSGTWSNTGTGSITLAGNLTNSGTITLNSNNLGCIAGANSIVIRSSVNNTLRSWANGSQGAGTFNIYNVDVDDMTGSLVTAQYSTLSGDTTWTVGTGCGISISGTANGNNTATVLVAVNGTLQVGKTGTIGGGAWTIAGVNAPATNDIVTVWVDNVTDNLESTAVTKYSGTGDISGMVLNTNILTIGSNQNNSVSVTNLGLCDVDTGCLDEDIMHTSNSGALLVQASGNTYTDETLKVLASNTLTVDSGATETVTTEKINNAGIITSIGSPTYTLAGTDGTPFVNSGTFTPSTSTVSYTGNNSGGNTTIENVTYYNMEVNNSAETYVLDSTLVGNTAGTLTITNGTLDTTGSNYGIQFGKINIANTSTAILTANSSTVTLSDTSGTLFTKGSTGVFNAGTSTVLISKQGTGTHTYNSKFGSAGTGNGQFGNYDFGIAVDPSGNIYLGDNSNSRVQKFDSSGTYVSQFGTLGTGNGQFNGSVTGVAIDSSGNIYVADGVLDRVQKFNSSGTYVSQFGSTGTGDGQFDTPFGIAIDPSDNIYVVDGVNSRVQKFDSSGTYVSKFGTLGTGNGQFTNPRGIAIDSSGNIFVVDAWNHRIEKFDSSGNYISQFNDTAGFSYPTGIHIDAYDNIYIADQGHSVISKFNSSGTFIADIATNGATDGLVNQAYNLSSNSSGDIYILDTYNKRIQKFTTANDTQTVSVASGSPSFYNLTFTSPGTKTIGETLTATGALTITAGTVDTVSGQNRTVNAGSIIINGGTFTPQASTVNVTGTGAVFNYTAGTFTAGASTIKLTDTSSTGKTFAGGGASYNNIWLAPSTGTGAYTISGNNTFADFKDDGTGAHVINFTAGSTNTISTLTFDTNSANRISLASTNPGSYWNFVDSSGTNTVSYISIQDSCASGGATWDALDGTNIDANNNCGWQFQVSRGGSGSAGGVESSANVGTCTDGQQNGDETGTDTGGRCTGGGGPGGGSGGVDSGQGVGTCTDGQQNGDETGTDTGGRCTGGGGQGGGSGDTGFLYRKMIFALSNFLNNKGYLFNSLLGIFI
jgi:autotransporter-associated beta strand protein